MDETNDLVSWLMASKIPSIRYFTLARLCGLGEEDGRVRGAREAIMREGPVPAILAGQAASGAWTGESSYYTPKYVSTHWSLMLLVELGVEGTDARFRRGVAHMLEQTGAGGLWWVNEEKPGLGCLWGNVLRYALHAGLEDDARVQQVAATVAREALTWGRCEHNQDVACAWGVARALWGLAALEARPAQVEEAIEAGVAFVVDRFRLREANYPLPEGGQTHALWGKVSFPLFYQADILFTLRVLAELGELQRAGAQEALDWLAARRMTNGRWRGSSPYRQRTWRELGDAEETRRWVSLWAAVVLGSGVIQPQPGAEKNPDADFGSDQQGNKDHPV